MKTLSIIIVNYNSTSYLVKCLDSLCGETGLPADWEVIVVDNGSEEEFKIQSASWRTKIQIIRNERNVGFAQANNQAIEKSSGKYVLLLNPDTIAAQETFTRLIAFMDQNHQIGIVTPKVLLASGQIDDASHRGFPTPWRALCHFSGISALFPKSTLFNGYHLGYKNMDKSHEIEACVGACMLIRRSVGDAVHWLDEDYFWYGEDLDFCYKVKEAGYQVWYVPEVSITHYKGVTSGIKKHSENVSTASQDTKRLAQKARFDAMKIFYRKHYNKKYPAVMTKMVALGIRLLEIKYVRD